MRRAALAALAVLAALAAAGSAGCGDLPPFHCEQDAECAGGTCASGGRCASPDPACASGKSYDASAGPLAGACVPMPPAGDAADQPRPLQELQTVDLAGARDDDAPSCAPGGRGRDVFFETKLGGRRRLYLDTLGSDFRAVLSVHRGPCAARTAELACGTASCSEQLHQWSEVVEPGTYCVIADRLDDADPGTTLVLRSFDGDPAPLGQLGVNAGNTCEDDLWAGCGRDGPDMTWFVTSCVPATISASICSTGPSFDGTLQVYSLTWSEGACTESCSGAEQRLDEPGGAWIVAEAPDRSRCGQVSVEITAR